MMSMPAAVRWLPLPPIPPGERTLFFTPRGDQRTYDANRIDFFAVCFARFPGRFLLPIARAPALWQKNSLVCKHHDVRIETFSPQADWHGDLAWASLSDFVIPHWLARSDFGSFVLPKRHFRSSAVGRHISS